MMIISRTIIPVLSDAVSCTVGLMDAMLRVVCVDWGLQVNE